MKSALWTDKQMVNEMDLIQKQKHFCSLIRNPTLENNVGIEQRRLAVYQELIFGNVEGFISNTFPILCSLYEDFEWKALIREFLIHHRAETPYFSKIAEEFIEFLSSHTSELSKKYPFVLELAHYEWVELALMISTEQISTIDLINPDEITELSLNLSPLAWPLVYQFEVHLISKDYIPTEPNSSATFIVVYRKSNDDVDFTLINAVTYKLLNLLSDNDGIKGKTLLKKLAKSLPQVSEQSIISNGRTILNDLIKRNIICIG